MDNLNICVILPAAGDGKRFGYNGSKEMYEIYDGIRIIDLSLQHIRVFTDWAVRNDLNIKRKVVTVIREGKEEIYDHVKRELTGIPVKKVMFNKKYSEWPGSIYSAKDLYSDINIVLLPDSFFSMSNNNRFFDEAGEPALKKAVEALALSPLVFGVMECYEPEELSKLGAVRTEGDIITAFGDKPSAGYQIYNGYWGALAFGKSVSDEVYELLKRGVDRIETDLKEYSFYPPGCFFLYSYMDLGTQGAVEVFREMYSGDSLLYPES